MAAYADDRGITTVQTEEHHGVDNNWLPSPFAFAGAVFGAHAADRGHRRRAIIGPLYDPLRLAEDIAVLDLLSGGRLVTVAGIGYRPEEYAQFDVEWKRRGRLQDEVLETLLKAWTGEPFDVPGPYRTGHPAPVHRPAPAAPGRRLLAGRRPPGRPAGPALLPQRAPAGAGGVLQGAAASTAPRAGP